MAREQPVTVFLKGTPKTPPRPRAAVGRQLLRPASRPEWLVVRAEHYCLPEQILGMPHFHPDLFQVFKVLDGKGVIHIGNESFDATVGGLFWVPPKVCHWSEDPPNQSPRMVEIRFRRNVGADGPFRVDRFPYHIATDRHPEVMECLNHIVHEFARKKPWWEWRISATLNELLAVLVRAIETPHGVDSAPRARGYRIQTEGVGRALDYIHQNYFRPVALDQLAHVAKMSVSRFTRIFAALEGTTPIDYLIDYRLKRATEMIDEGRLTLTQIAEAVGFNSIHHFSSCYKKRMGVCPSQRTQAMPKQ